MKVKKILLAVLILLLLESTATNIWAMYQGPAEIISVSLTERPRRTSVGDDGDNIHIHFIVRGDGAVIEIIWPEIKIYNVDGSTKKINISPGTGLDVEVKLFENAIYVLSTVSAITSAQQDTIYIYDYQGNLTSTIKAGGYVGGFDAALPSGEIFTDDGKNYYKYSSSGQLLKTYTSKPLELGVVKERVISSGKYKIQVTYDDKEYVIIDREVSRVFVRDESKNIYAINALNIKKYGFCGKLLGQVDMPSDVIFREKNVADREPEFIEHDRYGEPVVDIHGNVYTSKKTPTKYSILKWTWVDDPNVPSGPDVPSGLKVEASTTGLYISWIASPQDPGCVTGYEISRATSAGGMGTTVGTTTPGNITFNDSTAERGTTYYYKVRAVAGSEYSPFTSEVSGKRP